MADERTDLAANVRRRWDDADRNLALERRDYWLNLAFFYGEQWVTWNRSTAVVEQWRPHETDRVRLTDNRIQPNLVNLLAKLTKRPLAFEVLPSGVDDGTITGARLAEHVLESVRLDQGWEKARYEELFNAFLGSVSAVAVEWDGSAGEKLDIDLDTGRVIGTGEVRLIPLSIAEFTLEPGSHNKREARWWMTARAQPPEQVQERWNLSKPPKADSSAAVTPMQRSLLSRRGLEANVDLVTVFTLYERPHGSHKGRVVVTCGDEVLDQRPWPFPFDRLNVGLFSQQQLPMRWTGHTLLNDARPLQVAYNHARSNMQEHMKFAAAAKLAIPDTSYEYTSDMTDEPGEKIKYDAMSTKGIYYVAPPDLPRWMPMEAEKLGKSIDDLMSVHAVSRGEAPGDRNSGLALSVLGEKDETPLGLMAHDQANEWGDIASMVLEIYAKKAEEPRSARVPTESGVPMSAKWTGRQLRDQTQVRVPLDNVLPHSRVALQAQLTNLKAVFPEMFQGADASALARMMDLPRGSVFGQLANADVAEVERENHLMSAGIVPALDDLTPYPLPFQDHARHIAEHNRFRKSPAYMFGGPEVRQIVDLHIQAHERLLAEQAAAQLAMNELRPGLAAQPQADEPPGSAVPTDFVEEAPPGPQGTPPRPEVMPSGHPPGVAA